MQYFLSLLPLLACPIAMGAMMWFMMRGMAKDGKNQSQDQPMNESMSDSISRLRPQHSTQQALPVAGVHLAISGDAPENADEKHDADVATLQARLSHLQAQQVAIAGKMAHLADTTADRPRGVDPDTVVGKEG